MTISSVTICCTVRDERENIETFVRIVPKLSASQEILFVEGHSTDGTREEILRVAKKYPAKNIRVIGQPGTGQGDAIRVGFKAARGQIILLFDCDGTAEPNDLIKFYTTLKDGTYTFIEGNRFGYPLPKNAMPLINHIGNWFFAQWFSLLTHQPVHDVLSGIKGILKKDYLKIYNEWGNLGVTDPFGDFELLFGAIRLKLKTREIPMRYYPRTYGVTKTKVYKHGLILLRIMILGTFHSWSNRKSL